MSVAGGRRCSTHGQAALADMIAGIERARDLYHTLPPETDAVELEVRFGTGEAGGGFTAGVSSAAFSRIEARLDTGRDWARVDEWSNSRCFFHKRAADDARVRTEASVLEDCKHQIESLIKSRKTRYDWRVNQGGVVGTSQLAVRLDVNSEHRVPIPTDLSEAVAPHAVHLKQRKSYYYSPTGQTSPVWCYSLTRRWVGTTLEEALGRKAAKEPVYELEIECVDPSYLVASDTAATAYKTLSKIDDLIALIDPSLAKTPYALLPFAEAGQARRHNPGSG